MDKLEKRDSFVKKHRCLLITGGFLLTAFIISSKCPRQSTPVISIEDGDLQGLVFYSRNGSEYWSFRGIPYGEPPIGKLRFEPVKRTPAWKGVLKATKYKPHCKQFDAMVKHQVEGSEDCLYLHVYSPPINKNQSDIPVLVYMPGGGFLSGGTNFYFPDYFLDHRIVLVTFNYRLGPFGFLNLETEDGDGSLPRGNTAFKDQILALEWVQRNVKHFGGDPNRVTIMGQSAGAASVHYHVLTPRSHNLFHRAVVHSGSAFCPWAFSNHSKEISRKFVKRLGCPEDDREKMLTCLLNYDADEMVKQQFTMVDPRVEKDSLVPSIESFQSDEMFLTEHPLELAKKGGFKKVPLLLGMNAGEGAFRVACFDAMPDLIAEFDSNWTQLLQNICTFDNFPTNISDKVRLHYFGNISFSKEPMSFKRGVAVMASEAGMFEQVQRSALIHARSGAPTYTYFYNYRPIFLPGMYSLYRAVSPNDWLPAKLRVQLTLLTDWVNEHLLGNENKGAHAYGVVHGEDIFQLWNVDGESRLLSYWETDFSQSFVQMIVDFVLDVKPFSYRGTEFQPVNASAVDNGEKMKYMLLDNSKGKGKMIPEPFTEGIQFWRELGVEGFN